MSGNNLGYIYLLQDGNDKGTSIYKIGRTVQKGGDSRKISRLQAYSRGTIVYNTWIVDELYVNDIEKAIKETFAKEYRLVRGTEWFEGDIKEMKKQINSIIEKLDKTDNVNHIDNFINVEDVLRSDNVSMKDKSRIIECLKKVTLHCEIHDDEPVWGNCDIILSKTRGVVYKVHPDRMLTFIKHFDPRDYNKIGLL